MMARKKEMSLGERHQRSTEYSTSVVKYIRSHPDKKLELYNALAEIIGVKKIQNLSETSKEVDVRIGAVAYEAFRTADEQIIGWLKL